MSAVADALDIALFLVLLRFAAVVVVSVVVAVAGCRMFSRGWNCLAVEDTCFNRLLVIIIVPAIDVPAKALNRRDAQPHPQAMLFLSSVGQFTRTCRGPL